MLNDLKTITGSPQNIQIHGPEEEKELTERCDIMTNTKENKEPKLNLNPQAPVVWFQKLKNP